jgi:hypothetical protein
MNTLKVGSRFVLVLGGKTFFQPDGDRTILVREIKAGHAEHAIEVDGVKTKIIVYMNDPSRYLKRTKYVAHVAKEIVDNLYEITREVRIADIKARNNARDVANIARDNSQDNIAHDVAHDADANADADADANADALDNNSGIFDVVRSHPLKKRAREGDDRVSNLTTIILSGNVAQIDSLQRAIIETGSEEQKAALKRLQTAFIGAIGDNF